MKKELKPGDKIKFVGGLCRHKEFIFSEPQEAEVVPKDPYETRENIGLIHRRQVTHILKKKEKRIREFWIGVRESVEQNYFPVFGSENEAVAHGWKKPILVREVT